MKHEIEKPGPDGLVSFTLGRDWLGHKAGEVVRIDPEGAEQMYKAGYDDKPIDKPAARPTAKPELTAGPTIKTPPRRPEINPPPLIEELKIKGEDE